MISTARAMAYARPVQLIDALSLLSQGYVAIAGGTDYYPARVAQPISDALLDLSAIREMRAIVDCDPHHDSQTTLGALTTWTDCLKHPFPKALVALAQAAKQIGGWQIQNRATLGGNLCNASPAADGTVVLLALNAQVTLSSLQMDRAVSAQLDRAVSAPLDRTGSALAERSLPIDHFVLGNRKTALLPNELLRAITIPRYSERAKSVFLKLGGRQYLVISIVMVAVLIDTDMAGRISHCAIAVGACNRAAIRLTQLEQALTGMPTLQASDRLRQILPTALQALQPIDDVRGSANYRLHAAAVLIQQAVDQCL